MDTRKKIFLWIVSLIGIAGICIFVYFIITTENKYIPIAALIPFSLAFVVALNNLLPPSEVGKKAGLQKKKMRVIGIIIIIIPALIIFLVVPAVFSSLLKNNVSKMDIDDNIKKNDETLVDIKTEIPSGDANVIYNASKKEEENQKEKEWATGESGYKSSERFALEAAERDAYKKLKRRLNRKSFDYKIERDTVYLVEGYGYKAKIVIYTYQ